MYLVKYLRYNKLTDNNCIDDCGKCSVKKECDYILNNRPFSIKALSLMSSALCDVHDFVLRKYESLYPRIYICYNCGLISAPYLYNYSIEDFGWKKINNPKRWICHHCAYHKSDNGFTKETWQDFVQTYNESEKAKIDVIRLWNSKGEVDE